MKILYLPLKKEWYEMIERGEKTEEYREIKPYWNKRLINGKHTHVKFSYGYTKQTMIFEYKKLTIGYGNPEWGAPKEDCYIIKLGERIS